MKLQRLWPYAQGLPRFKPHGVLALRGGSPRYLPFLIKKLSSWQLFTGEKLVHSHGVSLGMQLRLQGGASAQQMANTKLAQWDVLDLFLSQVAFSGHF